MHIGKGGIPLSEGRVPVAITLVMFWGKLRVDLWETTGRFSRKKVSFWGCEFIYRKTLKKTMKIFGSLRFIYYLCSIKR